MASLKLKIRKDKKRKDGTCPIIIQPIKDGTPKRISLGHAVQTKDWDDKNQKVKKSHPNSTRLNNLLAKKLAEANEKLLEAETSDHHVTASSISNKIKKPVKALYSSNLQPDV